jgi:hypothetical protein
MWFSGTRMPSAGQYMGKSIGLKVSQVDLLRAAVSPVGQKGIRFLLVFAGHSSTLHTQRSKYSEIGVSSRRGIDYSNVIALVQYST